MFKILMRNPFRNDFEDWRECTQKAYKYEIWAKEDNSEKVRNWWLWLSEQYRYFAARAVGFKSFENLDRYLKKYGSLTIKGRTICSGERA